VTDRRLRPAAQLIAEGNAASPRPASTLFTRSRNVASERDYKRLLRAQRRISYHLQIGLSTWQATEHALRVVHAGLAEHGYQADRYGLALDRAMGVAAGDRDETVKETGPRLADGDWSRLGETVPIQPHLGDYMIGFPAGFENTCRALAAGVTTIGNVGQYTAYDLLGGSDPIVVTEQAVRALAAIAAAAPYGAMAHSNLEDGAAAKAAHYGSYVGFAALELYATETLIGAPLAHCFGNTIRNPESRCIVHLALDDLRGRDSTGSMIYGNTVDHRPGDTLRNTAAVATQLLCDIACQLHRPTGHAVNPVPLTEAERIPSAQEIIDVHLLARALEREARKAPALYDWPRLERLAASVAEYAVAFRDRTLALFEGDGVDVTDAGQLLLALRRTPIRTLEHRVALSPSGEIARLEPWAASQVREIAARLATGAPRLDGVRVVLGVLEVHQLVRDALAVALPRLGAEVVLVDPGVSVDTLVRTAIDEDADAIILGVYNGNALELGERIMTAANAEQFDGVVFAGGILNQDTGGALPVDARPGLVKLGIRCVERVEQLVSDLAQLAAG
jgi:methylmalonyl-CoA mutase cobalamin-binding subunit